MNENRNSMFCKLRIIRFFLAMFIPMLAVLQAAPALGQS
jgi:hypothetical protein